MADVEALLSAFLVVCLLSIGSSQRSRGFDRCSLKFTVPASESNCQGAPSLTNSFKQAVDAQVVIENEVQDVRGNLTQLKNVASNLDRTLQQLLSEVKGLKSVPFWTVPNPVVFEPPPLPTTTTTTTTTPAPKRPRPIRPGPQGMKPVLPSLSFLTGNIITDNWFLEIIHQRSNKWSVYGFTLVTITHCTG